MSTPLTTPSAPPYDAILFDFDGVIADSEPVHYECWSRVMRDYQIEIPWDEYQSRFVGVSDRQMIEQLASKRTPPLRFEEVWAEYPRKRAMLRARFEECPPFLPEILELVRELSGLYKLAVVSSSGRGEVEVPLERAGIRQYFQALVCGREAKELKPAPDPYLLAAELLRSHRPLVVEDSLSGVASASSAGFDVLRVSGPGAVVEEVAAALELAC